MLRSSMVSALLLMLVSQAQASDPEVCEKFFKQYEFNQIEGGCSEFLGALRGKLPGYNSPGSNHSYTYDSAFIRPFALLCNGGPLTPKELEATVKLIREGIADKRLPPTALNDYLQTNQVGEPQTNSRVIDRSMRVPAYGPKGDLYSFSAIFGDKIPKGVEAILDSGSVALAPLLSQCPKNALKRLAKERGVRRKSFKTTRLGLRDVRELYAIYEECAGMGQSSALNLSYVSALRALNVQYETRLLPEMMRGEAGCMDLIVKSVCGDSLISSMNQVVNPKEGVRPGQATGCECSVRELPDSQLGSLISGYRSKSLSVLGRNLKKCSSESDAKTVSDQSLKPVMQSPIPGGSSSGEPTSSDSIDSVKKSGIIR